MGIKRTNRVQTIRARQECPPDHLVIVAPSRRHNRRHPQAAATTAGASPWLQLVAKVRTAIAAK